MPTNTHMLRHLLATLAYRFHKTVVNAPTEFADLDAGYGIRNPLAIVHHMNGVLGYAKGTLEGANIHIITLNWTGKVKLMPYTPC
ncbi:MAG: hypothetical protein AAF267_10330 [Deinococcota bacterium]